MAMPRPCQFFRVGSWQSFSRMFRVMLRRQLSSASMQRPMLWFAACWQSCSSVG